MTEVKSLVDIRRDLHAHPELCFEEHRTSAIVAAELERLGYDVARGLAGTGVVGTLRNGAGKRAIAFRADMDALPITEETGLPYASKTQGKMHACGHDGHTAMLLGLARRLAAQRGFNGTVHLIFQPAEEDIGGAKRMIEEGLFQRFPVEMIFALHNIPGAPLGQIQLRPGAITAAVDVINITVKGIAGHGALPHLSADPVVAASALVMALQTLVSRNNDALEPAVLTVGSIHGGALATAIPESVRLECGLRTTSMQGRAMLLRRLTELAQAQARALGCQVEISHTPIFYPVGVNDPTATALVRAVACEAGQSAADVDLKGPFMFAEDFAFMLEKVPGCYFGLGAGPGKSLHDPAYDFNDALLEIGPVLLAAIAAKALPA